MLYLPMTQVKRHQSVRPSVRRSIYPSTHLLNHSLRSFASPRPRSLFSYSQLVEQSVSSRMGRARIWFTLLADNDDWPWRSRGHGDLSQFAHTASSKRQQRASASTLMSCIRSLTICGWTPVRPSARPPEPRLKHSHLCNGISEYSESLPPPPPPSSSSMRPSC